MNESEMNVVVGLGEVGKPLFELIGMHHKVVGVDISPPSEIPANVNVLHICYPFQIPEFVGESARYINMFKPQLTIINSTVAVGTTRSVADRSGASVAYSPVRGKHARMLHDMQKYAKFIGARSEAEAARAKSHFESLGLKTRTLSSPEAAELAKLTETTYFGVLIAWAQEVERYADKKGVDYSEVITIYEEVGFFPPVKYFPGVIGGHCVMPNIELLLKDFPDSDVLKAVKSSNQKKIEREARVNQVKK